MIFKSKEKRLKFFKSIKISWRFIINFNQKFSKETFWSKKFLLSEKNRKDILTRVSGNEVFRKKNLTLAIEFYNLSLCIINLERNLERSFCFSNRAQCLFSLKRENFTLIDCEMALKLVKNHEKSWYRKILVYYSKKDYVGNFYNFKKINSLHKMLGKIQLFPRVEILSKILIRLERNLSKRKYWKKLQMKKRKKLYDVILKPLKRIDNWKTPKVLGKTKKKEKNSFKEFIKRFFFYIFFILEAIFCPHSGGCYFWIGFGSPFFRPKKFSTKLIFSFFSFFPNSIPSFGYLNQIIFSENSLNIRF